MRALALLAPLAFLLLSGCLDTQFRIGMDCTADHQQRLNSDVNVLMPAAVHDDSGANRLTVHVRAGQTLNGAAAWQSTGGKVGVAFDGPASMVVKTDNSWTANNVTVPEGDYSLELVGDPLAFGVGYVLFLTAAGCTPKATS